MTWKAPPLEAAQRKKSTPEKISFEAMSPWFLEIVMNVPWSRQLKEAITI